MRQQRIVLEHEADLVDLLVRMIVAAVPALVVQP